MNPNRNQILSIPKRWTVFWLVSALLAARAATGQTIPNPSFEADTFTTDPGYISVNTPITGWTGNPTDRVGLNPAGTSPFADNGTTPDGNNVAFIQSNVSDPSTPSTLSTTISGLTAGTTYKVTFRVNAKVGTTPNVKVYMDGIPVLAPGGFPDGLSTAEVGGSNPYWHVAFEYMASAASQTLSIINDADGDQTLLVDDFKIEVSSGRWSVTGWYDDASSGVDPTYLYTHAYNFGTNFSPVINEVTFTGVPGAAPAVTGRFSTTYLGSGPVHDSSIAVYGNSGIMASDFVYGGDVPAGLYQSITLEGLTPGTEYVITVYSVAWEDPSVGSRWATFNVGDDYLTVNQDLYFNDYGIRVSYRYTADASGTMTLKFAPLIAKNVSFHVYGFSNREAESRFVAPVITAQPKSAIVSPGVPVSFTVAGTGVPLPTYQWRFDGGIIPDATNATYSLPAVSAIDAGDYDVVLANQAGSVTSVVARLTVGLPVANPSFELDGFYIWPGYVADNGPITSWTSVGAQGLNPVLGNPTEGPNPFADNGTVPNGSQVAFMQDPGTLSQVVSGLTVGGQYYVHYYENARTVTTIPGLEVKLGDDTVMPPHSITPVGGGNPYYEISSAVFEASATDLELVFVKSSPEGGDCTALIDNVAIIPVPAGTPPTIGIQPTPMTVYLGEPAGFGAMAQGSLPLHYQWQLNGALVTGATSNVLLLSAVTLSDEGDYTVVVTNDFGSVTSVVAHLSLLEAITTLHNTGIDASGDPLPAGAIDPFWTLQVNPDGGLPDVYVANEGWPIQSGVWMLNDATSKWVGSRAAVSENIPAGNYVYRTTFDLTGRDTNTVTITGRWASDDGGNAVFVNGATVSVPLSTSFGSWTTFTISTNNTTFLPGTNTIDFGLNNGSAGPSGLRLEFTRTSARTLPGVPAGIAVHPKGGTLAEGDTFVLTVSATGTLPITYQWKKDGVDLPDKTGSSLTLTSVTTNDSGNYSVAVTNLWGFAVSSNAAVVVAYRPLPGFFGTGVGTDGQLLAEADVDPHFILATSADPNFPGPDALVISNVWPIAAGVWLLNGPNSGWIGPTAAQQQNVDPTQGNIGGEYTYQTQFDLTGYDVSKVRLVGGWAADDSGADILVNGVSSGITCQGFGALTPFTITSGLVAGMNTLDFKVTNNPTAADPALPNPTGLRVDLKAYLDILPSAPKLEISRDGSTLSISWSGAGPGQKLQSAPAISGPWTDVPDATSPYTTTIGTGNMFFRIGQ